MALLKSTFEEVRPLRQFCCEPKVLSIFAEVTSQNQNNQCQQSQTFDNEKEEAKLSLEDTESMSESDNKSGCSPHDNSDISRKTFRLLYLPLHLPKADILQKLSKFGEVVDFKFCPVEKTDPHLQDPTRVPNFQCAEFSFAQQSSIDHFSGVKRIRVRGLQVRITHREETASSSKNSDSDGDTCSSRSYSVKPTSRKYFAHRPDEVQREHEYYWRRPDSKVSFSLF